MLLFFRLCSLAILISTILAINCAERPRPLPAVRSCASRKNRPPCSAPTILSVAAKMDDGTTSVGRAALHLLNEGPHRERLGPRDLPHAHLARSHACISRAISGGDLRPYSPPSEPEEEPGDGGGGEGGDGEVEGGVPAVAVGELLCLRAWRRGCGWRGHRRRGGGCRGGGR